MAFTRISPQADAVLEASYPRPLSSLPFGEQIRRGELVHVRDAEVELAEVPALREMAQQRGWRSSLPGHAAARSDAHRSNQRDT